MPHRFEPKSHPDCGGLPQPPVLQLTCVERDIWPLVRFPQTRVIVESLCVSGEGVYRCQMSGLGQQPPPRHLTRVSTLPLGAEVSGSMSGVGVIAEVDRAVAHVRA